MKKWVRTYMINVRLKTLYKVLSNAEKEDWPTLEVETRREINKLRMKLSELDS